MYHPSTWMPSEECWCVCVCMHQWIFEGFPSQHALCCFSCLHVWCKHASVSQANSIILLNNELKRPVFVYECGLRGKTKVLHNLSEWQDRVFKQTFLFYASASLCLCVNAALLEVFSVFFFTGTSKFWKPHKTVNQRENQCVRNWKTNLRWSRAAHCF